jgi:hypothetical protein
MHWYTTCAQSVLSESQDTRTRVPDIVFRKVKIHADIFRSAMSGQAMSGPRSFLNMALAPDVALSAVNQFMPGPYPEGALSSILTTMAVAPWHMDHLVQALWHLGVMTEAQQIHDDHFEAVMGAIWRLLERPEARRDVHSDVFYHLMFILRDLTIDLDFTAVFVRSKRHALLRLEAWVGLQPDGEDDYLLGEIVSNMTLSEHADLTGIGHLICRQIHRIIENCDGDDQPPQRAVAHFAIAANQLMLLHVVVARELRYDCFHKALLDRNQAESTPEMAPLTTDDGYEVCYEEVEYGVGCILAWVLYNMITVGLADIDKIDRMCIEMFTHRGLLHYSRFSNGALQIMALW